MKKIIVAMLCVVMVATMCAVFIGCGPKADFTIGISKFLKNAPLDEAEEGFKEEFSKLVGEKNMTVKYVSKDASGEIGQIQPITNDFVSKNVNLIFAIATPSVSNAVSGAKDKGIPVVGSAVTTYVKELLDSGILTGTSDKNPIELQFELMKLLDTKSTNKFGILYTTSETNSIDQRDELKTFCDADGITLVDVGVSDRNDIGANMNKLRDCGVVYVPTDNIMSSASPTIHSINVGNINKPIVWGELNPHYSSGVATYGVDYKELGRISARMAFDILLNGKKPSDMPIRTMDNFTFNINEKVAKEIGYEIPASVRALANA